MELHLHTKMSLDGLIDLKQVIKTAAALASSGHRDYSDSWGYSGIPEDSGSWPASSIRRSVMAWKAI